VFERREGSVLVGLIALIAVGIVIDASNFLTLNTVSRILRAAAPTAIVGYGVALLMVTAEFDLSVGSMFGLAGSLTATMMILGINVPFAILAVLVFALVFGISQGLLVTKLNLPSLIVTIGTLTTVRGFHRIILQGQNATVVQGLLEWLGGPVRLGDFPGLSEGFVFTYRVPLVHQTTQEWNGFSIMIVWALLFMFVFHYILFYTRFGHHVRATGDNIQSVGTTGVDPESIKLAAFGIAAMMAAFGGMAKVGRVGSVGPAAGDGLALTVIAAVVLGGTKLTGGEGSMFGVLLGALVLSTAENVLFLAGLGVGGWQDVVTGGFIIAAIGLDVLFKGFSTDLLREWYVRPIGNLVSSPSEFFRTRSIRKTTDDMFGFMTLSVGLATILTNVVAAVLGLSFVGSALVSGDLTGFKLIFKGNWPETVGQVYLFMAALVVIAFFAIETATRLYDREGDYESTLAIVSYSTAVAPLFAFPIAMFGFKLQFIGGPLVSAIVLMIPILLLMLGLMYVGTVETHKLPSSKAIVIVVAVVAFWAVMAVLTSWSLTNIQAG
jgi:ribose/xylose/arabinose/galactoside ABC-type transport system permease subunit